MSEAAPASLAERLRRAGERLAQHAQALTQAWVRALLNESPAPADEVRTYCQRTTGPLLDRMARGDVDGLLEAEAEAAAAAVRAGVSVIPLAAAVRALDRCLAAFLLSEPRDPDEIAQCLTALGELGCRRLEVLLRAQEEEGARRLVESQERGAGAAEQARDLARANEALRRAEEQSRHRAEQIELLGSVFRRIAGILEPEALMQVAADTIQARMNHTYVAVVVLDDEAVLVGRWAGRAGVGRRSSGRAQGPARGVIGRALRKKAPQVVADVSEDPDYHPDVPGTRSEMVIPLLDEGEVVGAIDFQAERVSAFDLDDVAVGETLAEFLVVALRNARLFAELREPKG